MRKLSVFNSVSLDGYFTDEQGDISWAHNQDAEFQTFVAENASGDGELLFGRVTYQMMASFWPTAQASQQNPTVAAKMNGARKVVFSRTLTEPGWQNTRLLKGELASEVRKLKQESGPGMVLLGSGSIVAQLSAARLIDEYQLVVCPIALGAGRTLFEGAGKLPLTLKKQRAFSNGSLVLWYEPVTT